MGRKDPHRHERNFLFAATAHAPESAQNKQMNCTWSNCSTPAGFCCPFGGIRKTTVLIDSRHGCKLQNPAMQRLGQSAMTNCFIFMETQNFQNVIKLRGSLHKTGPLPEKWRGVTFSIKNNVLYCFALACGNYHNRFLDLPLKLLQQDVRKLNPRLALWWRF